jgi:phage gp36-like protein
MQTLIKQPAEVLKHLLSLGGVVVQVIAVASVARGLVVGSGALGAIGDVASGALQLTLSGGTDGERYLVTGRAQTAGGEERVGELDVLVLDGDWETAEGAPPYLTITEFVTRFGLDEAVAMTDTDGSGRIDKPMLVAALADAQATADIHIAARYAVPLASVPAAIRTAVADLARARLYPRGAPEGVADQAKAALRMLERIGEGKLPLPAAAPLESPPASTSILIDAGRRRYASGDLEDY